LIHLKGTIDPEDREWFCYAETAPEIWETMLDAAHLQKEERF